MVTNTPRSPDLLAYHVNLSHHTQSPVTQTSRRLCSIRSLGIQADQTQPPPPLNSAPWHLWHARCDSRGGGKHEPLTCSSVLHAAPPSPPIAFNLIANKAEKSRGACNYPMNPAVSATNQELHVMYCVSKLKNQILLVANGLSKLWYIIMWLFKKWICIF